MKEAVGCHCRTLNYYDGKKVAMESFGFKFVRVRDGFILDLSLVKNSQDRTPRFS